MNARQAFELCLPTGEVLFCADAPTAVCPGIKQIFWDADGRSFWARLTNSFAQIDVADGSVMQVLREYEDGASRFTNSDGVVPHYIFDFVPSTMVAHLHTGTAEAIIDMETQQLYSLDWYRSKALSPDGAFVVDHDVLLTLDGVEYPSNELGYIISEDDLIPYYPCTTEIPADTEDYDPLWSVPEWSHDSQMLAYRCYMPQSDGWVVGLWVYSLQTECNQVISTDDSGWGVLSWSPDDRAVAQIVYDPSGGGGASAGLAVTLLSGENHVISLPLPGGDDPRAEIYSVTWIPHGWLQTD